MFGSNCYRKGTSPAGQEHRAQYSHPDDSDWTQSIPWVGTIDLSGEKIRTRTRRRARGDPVPTGGLHSPCMHSRVESFKRAKTEKDPMAYEADCFKADPEFVRVQCVWCCLFLTVPHLRRRQSLQRLARSLWSHLLWAANRLQARGPLEVVARTRGEWLETTLSAANRLQVLSESDT
jgi:hypothetical protein